MGNEIRFSLYPYALEFYESLIVDNKTDKFVKYGELLGLINQEKKESEPKSWLDRRDKIHREFERNMKDEPNPIRNYKCSLCGELYKNHDVTPQGKLVCKQIEPREKDIITEQLERCEHCKRLIQEITKQELISEFVKKIDRILNYNTAVMPGELIQLKEEYEEQL